MRRLSETLEDDPWATSNPAESGPPVPGLVLIFSVDRPAFEVIPLEGGAVELGRGDVSGVDIDDKRMSRRHARVAFDGRLWNVRDRDSRNGTAVDGEELSGERTGAAFRWLRTASSLFLFATDTRLYRQGIAEAGGMCLGPSLQRALHAVARAARSGRLLHITGESGSGKELAARAFHDAGPASAGPFLAVNGATLPAGLAERLLFGARRGAYPDATNAEGHFQRAHGGTLFLDEVAELDLEVQAKLLRVLDKGELEPLGAQRVEHVDVRFCSATHRSLRAQVAAGKMREDLFFRIGTPAVTLPPLRARLEEIPWLVARAVAAASERGAALSPHVSFVEACLERRWPGNVRELLAEVRTAAQLAAEDGTTVLGRHLSLMAGTPVDSPAVIVPRAAAAAPARAVAPAAPAEARPSDEAIEAALGAAKGNISRAARALGMHRTQLCRWLARRDAKPGAAGGKAGDGGSAAGS